MPAIIVNVHDHPYWRHEVLPDGRLVSPGLGPVRADVGRAHKTKFIGDSEAGPWIFLLELPAGSDVSRHSHRADRIEYVLEGEIEWKEDDGTLITYGAGTLSYVTAGTFYQYRTTKDTKILLWFASRPGYSK